MPNNTIKTGNMQAIQKLCVEISTQHTLTTAYAHTFNATPVIDLSIITIPAADAHVAEDIKNHQSEAWTALGLAVAPNSPQSQAFTQSAADALAFVALWKASYDALLQLAGNLAAGDNKNEFADYIDQLVGGCTSFGALANAAGTNVSNSLADLRRCATSLSADEKIITKIMDGDSGTIKTLKDKIDDLNSRMEKANKTISDGASEQGVGVVIMVVVIVGESFSQSGKTSGDTRPGEGSTKVMGTSISMMHDGEKHQSEAIEEWNKCMTEYKTATINLATDKILFASVKQLSTNLALVISNIEALAASETKLEKAWQAIGVELTEINTNAASPSFDKNTLKTSLIDMNGFVESLGETALALQLMPIRVELN